MNSLNNMPCLVGAAGNLNVGNCNQDLKDVQLYLAVQKGTKFTQEEMAGFVAKISPLLHADNTATRIQIIKGFKGVEKANVEAGTFTWGDGSTQTTRDEIVGRTYQMKGDCLNQLIASLNDMSDSYELIPVFSDNVAVATLTTLEDGSEGVKGFSVSEIFASQYDETINDTPGNFTLRIIHADPSEWRNRIAFRPTDGNIKDLSGIQTISFSKLNNSPQVAGTYRILAATGCGSVNVGKIFAVELADEALWVVTNQLGNVVPVDGVTVNANGEFIIALTTASANYTAGTRFTVTLVAPSLLSAAGVEWYEGGSVSFPK